MRVLLIAAEYPPTPGGIGDYTALLAAHLANADAAVSVLTGGAGDTDRDGDVTVYRHVAHWGRGVAATVRRLIASEHPDIVHLQYQTGMYGMHPAVNFLPDKWIGVMPLLHGQQTGFARAPRFITTFHDLRAPYLFPKAGPLRALVMRHLARASHVALATNGADAATLARWGARSAIIPIGSNIPAASDRDASSVRIRFGIPDGAVLLTTFGLLNHSKGIDTAIEALGILQRRGVEARLLIVGAGVGASDPTNRATEAAIDAQSAATGVADSVIRTGPLRADDVARVLAASDACLLPYRDGASPRRGSLLAALAQSIPVVTTTPLPHSYDGLPDPRDSDAAILVPPGDSAAIADAVRRIVNDGALAARLRSAAAAYAMQFAWPTIAARTLAVYAAHGLPAPSADAIAPVAAVER